MTRLLDLETRTTCYGVEPLLLAVGAALGERSASELAPRVGLRVVTVRSRGPGSDRVVTLDGEPVTGPDGEPLAIRALGGHGRGAVLLRVGRRDEDSLLRPVHSGAAPLETLAPEIAESVLAEHVRRGGRVANEEDPTCPECETRLTCYACYRDHDD